MQRLIKLLQSGSENRESFFGRVEEIFPTLDPRYKAIEKAYNDAKDAFREKWREDGRRYFEHLRAVALILMVHLRVKNHHLIIAALLHDIVEDCPEWTVQRVQAEYGDGVALLVEWLTKPTQEKNGLSKEERACRYHERFRFAPREFFLIKLADRLHNLITLWACDDAKKRRKIRETRDHYLLWAEEHCILIHELEEAIERLETKQKSADKIEAGSEEHF
ncbi:MAG: HD domain-containing protein [Patescibacteria group bacterium]